MQKKFLRSWVVSLMVLAASLWGACAQAADTASEAVIGAETCRGCHETQYETYASSVHSNKHVQGPANKEACETCHGPGGKHVEKGGGRQVDIFDFGRKVNAAARSAKCLLCHEEMKDQAFWGLGRHKTEGVACNDCHRVHSSKRMNLKETQPDLCFDCHKDIRSMVNRQSHHPLAEGKVFCTDCHEVHGSFGPRMVKADSVNELCFKCHAEKRGPFRVEHQPVVESCLNCHNPHGSNHRALLASKPPQLCQECHGSGDHNGRAYTRETTFRGSDPQIQMFGRACMNCHTNIHGSSAEWLK